MPCRNLTLVTILIVSLVALSTSAFPFLPRTGVLSSAFANRPLLKSSDVDEGATDHTHPGEPWGSPTMYYKLAVSAALVLGGGVFAGWVFLIIPFRSLILFAYFDSQIYVFEV